MFLKNTMFREMDLFTSSGKIMGASALSSSPTVGAPSLYLRMETDSVSET
jgi:hypothetical protein